MIAGVGSTSSCLLRSQEAQDGFLGGEQGGHVVNVVLLAPRGPDLSKLDLLCGSQPEMGLPVLNGDLRKRV